MWWLLLVTPAAGFVGAIVTGYTAHSPDEAFGGAGPDALLLFAAVVIAVIMLARVAWRWRRLAHRERLGEILTALMVIPLFFVYAAVLEIIGWPNTRSAGVTRFGGAVVIVVAWTALVLRTRRASSNTARRDDRGSDKEMRA